MILNNQFNKIKSNTAIVFLSNILAIVILLNIFQAQFLVDNKIIQNNLDTSIQNCIKKNDVKNFSNESIVYSIIELEKNISVSSDIKNVFCLGKVVEVQMMDSEILLFLGKSERFTRIVSVSFLTLLIIINFIFKTKNLKYQLITTVICLQLFNKFLDIVDPIQIFLSKSSIIFIILTIRKYLIEEAPTYNFKRIRYRTDINILRAVAVLSVLFYHAGFELFEGGWLGVDIFFVISGFLISNIILSNLTTDKFSFKSFYSRRVKRIIPAYYFTIIFTIPLSYYLLAPKSMIEYLKTLLSSVFFISNIYLSELDFYTAEPQKLNPLLHSWSLSIEEQFYLIFPLFLFLIFKFKNSYIYILSVSFVLSIFLNVSINYGSDTFYLIQYRYWELLLGCLIMIYLNNKKTKFKQNYEILGLFLIISPILYFEESNINELFPKIICLSGVALIILNDNNNKLLSKITNFKLLNHIGLTSFSIYLLHQPIYAFARNYLKTADFKWYQHLFLILIILILSHYSYFRIELTFLNGLSSRKILILIIIVLFSLTYSYFGIKEDGFASRYPDIPEQVLYYSINTNLYPGQGDAEDWEEYNCQKFLVKNFNFINRNNEVGFCGFTKSNAISNLYLIGDSHANTLSVTIARNGEKLNDKYNFIPINATIGRCLLSGQNDSFQNKYDCSEMFFNDFIDQLKKDDVVVIVGRFPVWLSSVGETSYQCNINCDYRLALKNRITLIAGKVESLIIIYPIPTQNYNISDSFINGKNEWGSNVGINYADWIKIANESYQFLDNLNIENSKKLLSEELFCNSQVDKVCVATFNNVLYYTDDNHLTIEGNYLIFEKIKSFLNN